MAESNMVIIDMATTDVVVIKVEIEITTGMIMEEVETLITIAEEDTDSKETTVTVIILEGKEAVDTIIKVVLLTTSSLVEEETRIMKAVQ